MSVSKRLPVALGGLGAVVVLGLGASFAAGGEQSNTDHVRSALHSGKPKNVIFFLGDGMGTQEITAARYYQGVNHRLNVDRLPFTGFQTTWSIKPAAAPPYLPDYDPDSASTGTMWATGEKTIDERISQGPSAGETSPARTSHGARGRAEGGQEDRQRLDRGDHRRDAGRAGLAHLAARLPGPERHALDLPDRDQGRRRPRLDRRADRRPQGRRHPRRRPQPVHAAAHRRAEPQTSSTTPRARATSTSPTPPGSRPCSAASRCSACSPAAT